MRCIAAFSGESKAILSLDSVVQDKGRLSCRASSCKYQGKSESQFPLIADADSEELSLKQSSSGGILRAMKTSIHHLDTSALVKLVLWPDIKERGSEALSEFRNSHTGFYTLDLCVGEAFNVLKRKFFLKSVGGNKNQEKDDKKLRLKESYFVSVERLRGMIKSNHTFHVVSADLIDNSRCLEALELTRIYEIDFVDALVILDARYRRPWSDSQNLLITAEHEMVKVAKHIGMPFWQCHEDTNSKFVSL